MATASYLVRRVLSALVVLLVIAALTFLVFHLLPSDVTQASCGKPCTPEREQAVRHFYGYDQPMLVRWGESLRGTGGARGLGPGAGVVHCDAPCFGSSSRLPEPVTTLIGQYFPVTASIAIG